MENDRELRQRAAELNNQVTQETLRACAAFRAVQEHHRVTGHYPHHAKQDLQQVLDTLRRVRVQQLRLQADMMERKNIDPFNTNAIPSHLPEDLT